MKGDPQVIRHLNSILTSKLTAINQYFLQSRMLKNLGLLNLAEHLQGEARSKVQEAVKYCEEVRDFVSRELLTGILNETEAHIDWLTYQIRLINAVGEENY